MKRFVLLLVLILCFSVPLMFIAGCAKKEEPKTETEQMEEAPAETTPAPADTAAPDTTQME